MDTPWSSRDYHCDAEGRLTPVGKPEPGKTLHRRSPTKVLHAMWDSGQLPFMFFEKVGDEVCGNFALTRAAAASPTWSRLDTFSGKHALGDLLEIERHPCWSEVLLPSELIVASGLG